MFVGLRININHYRKIVVNLSRQKELDANPKAFVEFVGKLENVDEEILDNESMFVLMNLEKIKETWLKLSQESKTVF